MVRWRFTKSGRLLDGTCEQFFSRLLLPAAANFQKREYAEHQDHCGHNAEQSPTAKESARAPQRGFALVRAQTLEGAFSLGAPQGNGTLTMLPLNRLLEIGGQRDEPAVLRRSSELTQFLSQHPHLTCLMPQPPARGDRLGGVVWWT